jgi:hypothetical protein
MQPTHKFSSTKEDTSLLIEDNIAIVRRYFEAASYNPEVCQDNLSSNVHWHALYRTDQLNYASNPSQEQAACQRHITLWGGWCEPIDEMIAEGDRVVVRWTFLGTHRRMYLGIPPSNKPVTFSGICYFALKIVVFLNCGTNGTVLVSGCS